MTCTSLMKLPDYHFLLLAAPIVGVAGDRGGFAFNVRVCVLFQECVCVYVLDGESRLVSEEPPHQLPKEGKIRWVVVYRMRGHAHHTMCADELELCPRVQRPRIYIHYPTLRLFKPVNNQLDCGFLKQHLISPHRSDRPQLISFGSTNRDLWEG